MAGGDRGKDFERMMANLLGAVCSRTRRVFDARAFREVAKFAPAVHCDYEAVVTGSVPAKATITGGWVSDLMTHDRWDHLRVDRDLHLYFEMKASNDRNKFEFLALIRGGIKPSVKTNKSTRAAYAEWVAGGKAGVVPDEWWSKVSQWGFCREVAMNAATEQYWYMVGCKHTPGGYYALMLDWEDVAYWLGWLEAETKRLKQSKVSVPWESLKRRAMERGGLDRILYQGEGDTTDMRFVTDENVAKLRKVLGIEDWEVRKWR